MQNVSHFDTATDSMTDWVNIERVHYTRWDAVSPMLVLSGAYSESFCK